MLRKRLLTALVGAVGSVTLPFILPGWAVENSSSHTQLADVGDESDLAVQLQYQQYSIQLGDTLSSLSRTFGLSVEILAALNGINNPDAISAGEPLIVVVPVWSNASRSADTAIAPNLSSTNLDFSTSSPSESDVDYIWPTYGTLTSGYGWRWGRMHRGVDIAAPAGTPVMATAEGVVTYAGWNTGGYGNLVEIRHADGTLSRYAHNSRLWVELNQTVVQGQLIAEMGSTGRSTGPHLHFELHHPEQGSVDPLSYFQEIES